MKTFTIQKLFVDIILNPHNNQFENEKYFTKMFQFKNVDMEISSIFFVNKSWVTSNLFIPFFTQKTL